MKRVLLSLTLLLAGSSMTHAQSTLSAGEVAIVAVASDDPDEFGLLLLADVLSGTEILFTDMGWSSSSSSFRQTEDSMTWKANTNLPAGTLILFDNDITGTTSVNYGSIIQGKLDDLSDNGDQILVFQGTMANPTFLCAANFDGIAWAADATSANNSALPPGLVNGVNAVTIEEHDNLLYMGDSIGNSVYLRGQVNDSANWARSDSRMNFDPDINGRQAYLVDNGTPAIRTYSNTFNGDFGQVIINAQSAASGFFVGGRNLATDIVISVNPPFEVSINGGTYASSGNITPSSGTVNPTIVEVRMSPTVQGVFMDTVQITSTGAFTNQLLLSGEGLPKPVVSFLNGSGMYDEGGIDSIGLYVVDKGSSTVVVDIMSQPMATAIEGMHYNYPNSPQAYFDPSTPDTIYVPIEFLDDNNSGPRYRTNRLSMMVNGGDPGIIDSFDMVIRENDYKYVKIAEIKQLDGNGAAISSDSLFEVSGLVYGTNTQSGGDMSFTVIDETAGISNYVFSGEPTFGYTVTEGDSVMMRGRLTQVDGLIQLDLLDTIKRLKTNLIIKSPVLANTVLEEHENDLVRINQVAFVNQPFAWNVSGSGTGYAVYNTVTFDTFEVFVRSTSGLANTSAPTGNFDIVGLGGQMDPSSPYDEGYRILPRYASDVIIDALDSFKLNSPVTNTTVTLQGSPTQTVTFDWFAAKRLTAGPVPSYSILFDLSTGDFFLPIMDSTVGTDTFLVLTYKELIDGLGVHLPNGGSLSAQWTVKADNGIETEWSRTIHIINFERGVIDGLVRITDMARIYPNPAQNRFYVEMEKAADYMRLYDMNGKSVLEIDDPAATQEIHVGRLPEGVYLLTIQADGKLFSSRLVVAKK